LEWFVKVGDVVEKDQGLVEISTDKVDAELPSPVAGTVTELLAKPDDVVATGTVVCRIAPGVAAAAAKEPETAPAKATTGNGDLNATPVAARMASANDIDIAGLQGSGPRGRVTKDDVEAAINGNGATAAAPAPPAPAGAKPRRSGPEGVSLGLAVDVERKDGTRSLVVPVLDHADALDFPTSAARYDELVAGARDNTLKPDAYAGANISLTNPGGIGTVAS